MTATQPIRSLKQKKINLIKAPMILVTLFLLLNILTVLAHEISPYTSKTKDEKKRIFEQFEQQLHPLHKFAAHNRVDLIETLPDGDVDVCDNCAHNTPLMLATVYRSREAARYLFVRGANPFQQNILGISAYDIATRDNDKELIALFNTYMAPASPSFYLHTDELMSCDPQYEPFESESDNETHGLLLVAAQEISGTTSDHEAVVDDPEGEKQTVDAVVEASNTNVNQLSDTYDSFISHLKKHPYYQHLSKRTQRTISSIAQVGTLTVSKSNGEKSKQAKTKKKLIAKKTHGAVVKREPSNRRRNPRTFYGDEQ